MASLEDKENMEPRRSSDAFQRKAGTPSPKKTRKKGRSKSIGPGGLDDAEQMKADDRESKNRRKSAFIPATKSIISKDTEKAQRQAARRKTLANRRVSFAPEATLHTWDVIEFMRDPTTSTDTSDSTRRASNIERNSTNDSPLKENQTLDSDPPSTPPEQAEEDDIVTMSPAHQRDLHQKKNRRSSGIPPMNFNNPDDAFSSDGPGDSSEVSGSEEDGEEDEESDDSGTAMSLDGDDPTMQSMAESESSTGSSARLEAALREAAHTAGTRGIDYDEYGDASVSMEIAGEEITNAFKPWAGQRAQEPLGSASFDQENVNPFSPAFKAQLASGPVSRPETVEEEETGDLSMDMTRHVGGIMNGQSKQFESSPLGGETMDLTQAVGRVQSTQSTSPKTHGSQKRRRSTDENGSPSAPVRNAQSKRRRSSIARSSMGDDTMDLTVAMGGIESSMSPAKVSRRRSAAKRVSLDVQSEPDEATMEFTQAVGGINAPSARRDATTSSIDENEELTMEMTAVLGGIQAGRNIESEARPVTPAESQSPVQDRVQTTPRSQERFKDVSEYGAKKLLTPVFQKQALLSAEKNTSSAKTMSSQKRTRTSLAYVGTPTTPSDEQICEKTSIKTPKSINYPELPSAQQSTEKKNTARASPSYPKLSPMQQFSPLRRTPLQNNRHEARSATPKSSLKQHLDGQLREPEASPTAQKQQRSSPSRIRSSPAKPATPIVRLASSPPKKIASPARSPPKNAATPPSMAFTPEQATRLPQDDGRKLANNIKLMSTPRKETLKTFTPRKQMTASQTTPQEVVTPRLRPTPKSQTIANASPARQLTEDLKRIEADDTLSEPIRLQQFLDLAGIRFMDLTATKRRLTTAPTPSKARHTDNDQDNEQVTLEAAITAGACTLPSVEMFEHACHELKRYISDGKKVIKSLEAEAAADTPPLLQAYMAAGPARKTVLDGQLREIKTHARLRSKEMWYAWRSQLLDDLLKGLQGIAEGLIKDDETLQRIEEAIDAVLPGLVQKREEMQAEAEQLERQAAESSQEEREELEGARERLLEVETELEEKRQLLEALQKEAREQDEEAEDLEETRAEFVGAIAEAEKVKEACRGVSIAEINALQKSVANLTNSTGWSLTTATADPPTLTLTLASALTLFLHPTPFVTPGASNAPISLTHTSLPIASLPTAQRFFLQHLRAVLQALPQATTKLPQLLAFVKAGWELVERVSELERCLALAAGPTEARIVDDERVLVETTVLVPKLRTKVRVAFEVKVVVAEGLAVGTEVGARVGMVYGPTFEGAGLGDVVKGKVKGLAGWVEAVDGMRERMEEWAVAGRGRGKGGLRR